MESSLAVKFEVGQTVGNYEFLAVLDSSPTGVKYKVRNVVMNRLEVLKVLPSALQEDEQPVERFHREVAIWSRLSHPNIVSFYNAMPLGGGIVMTTEWIEGSTLEQLVQRGAIPLKEAVNYVSQALSALVYVHANGVVHRNLTPSCAMITEQRKLKLGEFELAKKYADQQLTLTGTTIVAPEYASPEQVKAETRLDERSDIYSMGVILFELATGWKPFSAKGQFEIMRAHVEQEPPAPHDLNSVLSHELSNVILRALAKNPSERFQSAINFRTALQEAPTTHPQKPSQPRGGTLDPSPPAEGMTPRQPTPEVQTAGSSAASIAVKPIQPAASADPPKVTTPSQMRPVKPRKKANASWFRALQNLLWPWG